jgi:hypothetical protein
MPIVKLHRRAGRPTAENAALLEATHAALVEAFKVPDGDRTQLLIEHEAAHFEISADRTEAFTLVEILAYPGRSLGAKRALHAALARRFEAAGVSPADLWVILIEPALENWSVGNGVSSIDAKPPFKLNV